MSEARDICASCAREMIAYRDCECSDGPAGSLKCSRCHEHNLVCFTPTGDAQANLKALNAERSRLSNLAIMPYSTRVVRGIAARSIPQISSIDTSSSNDKQAAEAQFRDQVQELLRSQTEAIKHQTDACMSLTDAVTSQNGAVSSHTNAVKSLTDAINSQINTIMSHTTAIQSLTEAINHQTEAIKGEDLTTDTILSHLGFTVPRLPPNP